MPADALPEAFEPRRILLVKPSALGDVVHALPVANLMKKRWPRSHLAWWVSRPFASLLETHPAVDEVVPWDRQRGATIGEHLSAGRELSRRLKDGAFDLAVDLQGLLRSALPAWRARIPVRVGFAAAREGAWLGYTHRVADPPGLRHAVERYLDVADFLGCGRTPVDFDIRVTDADEARADELLAPLKGRPFALLMPGTNWPTKRWPAAHFTTLATLVESHLSLAPVTAGAADAAEAAAGVPGLNLTNQTTVRELIALLKRAALVVCNDSGPMHLAAALRRPLVALFGPTDPHRTGPFGSEQSVVRLDVPCAPCLSRRCAHQTCLAALSPGDVLGRCRAALQHG